MLLELLCLATNIYFEARGEDLEGQIAVAEVTLNRVVSDEFPNSICDVVHQGGENRYKCQFSWYCDGKSDIPRNKEAWNKALDVALAYTKIKYTDITGGALFYHSVKVAPSWAERMELTATVGGHKFYALQKA